MKHPTRTIHVPDDSELSRALAEATELPVRLENNGVLYQITPVSDDRSGNLDPEATRAGMAAATGKLTPKQAEELKAYIYRGREEGSRPIDRP